MDRRTALASSTAAIVAAANMNAEALAEIEVTSKDWEVVRCKHVPNHPHFSFILGALRSDTVHLPPPYLLSLLTGRPALAFRVQITSVAKQHIGTVMLACAYSRARHGAPHGYFTFTTSL
jgi:hypothetical protein